MAWVAEQRTHILAEWVAQNPSLIPVYTSSSRRFNCNFIRRKGTIKAQERGLRNSTASPIRRHLPSGSARARQKSTDTVGGIFQVGEREREKETTTFLCLHRTNCTLAPCRFKACKSEKSLRPCATCATKKIIIRFSSWNSPPLLLKTNLGSMGLLQIR